MRQDATSVSFRNGAIQLAGDLRVPKDHEQGAAFAALVIATPGSSVKEQIGANYAERLTANGFVTLAFDPSYQGQSGGEPRDLEDPAARVEDIRCAVDYLMTLPYVDEERVGLLGICAGGGYAVNAALTEHRIKALGTVVPVNIGRARRQGGRTPDAVRKMLEAVGTIEARGGASRRDPWIPDSVEEAHAAGITDPDLLDAVDFYRTPRGYSEHSTNRRYFTSLGPMIGFDAFHLVGELLTQPVQVIVAGRLGATFSYADGRRCSNARTTGTASMSWKERAITTCTTRRPSWTRPSRGWASSSVSTSRDRVIDPGLSSDHAGTTARYVRRRGR